MEEKGIILPKYNVPLFVEANINLIQKKGVFYLSILLG